MQDNIIIANNIALSRNINNYPFPHKLSQTESQNISQKINNIILESEDLSEDKKIEYLTWLDNNYDAILNLDIINKRDKRDHFKKNIWGGESSNSIFEWEPLNDIQCVYLPALRDAEKKLRASRGSRLARLLLNLSQEDIQKCISKYKEIDENFEVPSLDKIKTTIEKNAKKIIHFLKRRNNL